MPQIVDPTWLTVNGIDLATPAWRIFDLSELLNDVAPAGNDLALPLADGVRPYPRRRRARVCDLPMDITGDFDQDGAVVSDPVQGVIEHLLYLSNTLGIGSDATSPDGTVPAVWHLPNSSTLTADVHVIGLLNTTEIGPGVLRTVLELSIPAGGFAELLAS